MSHAQYIRRETFISMMINGALSAAFFLLIFVWFSPVPLWGIGNWIFDFLPQSFMIGLMSTIVPGAITKKRLRDGTVRPSGAQTRLPQSLILRALLLAAASALIGTAAIAAIAALTGAAEIGWSEAFALKVLYGIILAAIVTPPGLRTSLAR
ncbi:MAG: hypothetical protein CMN73_03035 [Sphingomonas sp.]|nr:hypothetical protein [Sphingomonas sp.]